MKTIRHEITGEWSGPASPAGDYTRIVHREVTKDAALVEFVRQHDRILYTDGTCLILSVRPLAKGERARPPKLGYSTLIRDCARFGVSSVAEVQAAREQQESPA